MRSFFAEVLRRLNTAPIISALWLNSMNQKRHKKTTVLIGYVILVSVVLHLFKIFINGALKFKDMFIWTKDIGLPWIPYVVILVIVFSLISALGLIKYRRWGFYNIYIAYLLGISVAYFPFFPTFVFNFISVNFGAFISIFALFTMLGIIINLQVTGNRQHYWEGDQDTPFAMRP